MNDRKAPRDRQSDLAAIHITEKTLHLDRDAAQALKLDVIGKASSADMSGAERRRYLAHLHRLQAAVQGGGKQYSAQRPPTQRSRDDAHDDRWGKARAIWSALAQAGQVRADTDSALLAYVKRQTGVDAWAWLTGHQINTVIESLKRWARRTGVQLET